MAWTGGGLLPMLLSVQPVTSSDRRYVPSVLKFVDLSDSLFSSRPKVYMTDG